MNATYNATFLEDNIKNLFKVTGLWKPNWLVFKDILLEKNNYQAENANINIPSTRSNAAVRCLQEIRPITSYKPKRNQRKKKKSEYSMKSPAIDALKK